MMGKGRTDVTQPRIVEHPQLGPGTLRKTYMGGHEWEVEFDSGRRFRLPAREFEPASVETWTQHAPTLPALPAPRPRILETDQFRARQTLEALRFGIVPVQDVETLTIGLEAESVSLNRALARTKERGGDVQVVIGDYGFGKSHFVELAARRALRQNFLVMAASLDLLEAPPNKPYEVYCALVKSLRYPDAENERGLARLLKNVSDRPVLLRELIELSPIPDRCPLALGLGALQDSTSQAVFNDVVRWLSGDTHPDKMLKPYIQKLPRLYKVGETSRLYTYLLTGISEIARRLGYSGLAVLIDESEHYSLLRARQRGRADSFFTALIAGAAWTNGGRIVPDEIPHNHYREYPVRFADEPHLFFLFALTESESKLPVDVWLSPTQMIRLDDRYIEDDIRRFMNTLVDYHALAYDYRPSYGFSANGAMAKIPSLLSRSLSQHRINLRELIRISVTVFDLLYLYDTFTPEDALEELGQGLNP
jgi:hypothetical protein